MNDRHCEVQPVPEFRESNLAVAAVLRLLQLAQAQLRYKVALWGNDEMATFDCVKTCRLHAFIFSKQNFEDDDRLYFNKKKVKFLTNLTSLRGIRLLNTKSAFHLLHIIQLFPRKQINGNRFFFTVWRFKSFGYRFRSSSHMAVGCSFAINRVS